MCYSNDKHLLLLHTCNYLALEENDTHTQPVFHKLVQHPYTSAGTEEMAKVALVDVYAFKLLNCETCRSSKASIIAKISFSLSLTDNSTLQLLILLVTFNPYLTGSVKRISSAVRPALSKKSVIFSFKASATLSRTAFIYFNLMSSFLNASSSINSSDKYLA